MGLEVPECSGGTRGWPRGRSGRIFWPKMVPTWAQLGAQDEAKWYQFGCLMGQIFGRLLVNFGIKNGATKLTLTSTDPVSKEYAKHLEDHHFFGCRVEVVKFNLK